MAADKSEVPIYSMIGVTKRVGKKDILKDINLSYFHGAKIGVLGLNGSGKSTLLKILAGIDTEFDGHTEIKRGFTIGYLEQEPLVDAVVAPPHVHAGKVQPRRAGAGGAARQARGAKGREPLDHRVHAKRAVPRPLGGAGQLELEDLGKRGGAG